MSSLFADILRDPPTHVPLKVMLFTKIQEMKGSLRVMAQIQEWSLARRRKWVKEYGGTLTEVATMLSQQSPPEVEDFDYNLSFMDGDTLKLMGEYASHLREFIHMSRSVIQSTDVKRSSAEKAHSGRPKSELA